MQREVKVYRRKEGTLDYYVEGGAYPFREMRVNRRSIEAIRQGTCWSTRRPPLPDSRLVLTVRPK